MKIMNTLRRAGVGYLLLCLLLACVASFASGEGKSDLSCVGHLVPDTDAIVAAVAAAEFYGGTAARAGEMNLETRFLLDRFKIKPPALVKDFSGRNVFLVDFNQAVQAPAGIDADRISGMIDHHALQGGGFVFQKPISITLRPWGSTSTILATMFLSLKKPVSPDLAGAMVGAILSDTLNLQSPTTTSTDREMVKALASMAGLSFPEGTTALFQTMMEAKSAIDQLSAEAIVSSDYKTYSLAGKKIGFGVAETLRPEVLLSRKPELLEEMSAKKKKDNLDYLFFCVIDSRRMQSRLFIVGDREDELARKAFQASATAQIMDIGSLTSRKKQLIPHLQKALESQ